MSFENYRNADHPGVHLVSAYLSPLKLSVAHAAQALGVEPAYLSAVVAGMQPVTIDLALRLEKVIGLSAPAWLDMQSRYDLSQYSGLSQPLKVAPLESRYWGQAVASFEQSIARYESQSTCKVTYAFSPEGQLMVIMSQPMADIAPALTNCVEAHAITAFKKIVQTSLAPESILSEAALKFFKDRLIRAWRAIQSAPSRNLEVLTKEAGIVWYEHYGQSLINEEQCFSLGFYENQAIHEGPYTGQIVEAMFGSTIHAVVSKQLS